MGLPHWPVGVYAPGDEQPWASETWEVTPSPTPFLRAAVARVSANFRNRPVTLVCQTPGENAHEEGFFLTPKAKETRAEVKKKKNLIPKVSIAWATIAADLVSQTQWTFPLLSPQNVHGRPFLNTSTNQHQFLLTIKTMSHPWAGSESGSVVSDSSLHNRLYSPWNSPGQNTGVGSHSLLQGIFPTQGYNPDVPHCRQIPFFFFQFSFVVVVLIFLINLFILLGS